MDTFPYKGTAADGKVIVGRIGQDASEMDASWTLTILDGTSTIDAVRRFDDGSDKTITSTPGRVRSPLRDLMYGLHTYGNNLGSPQGR